jgi:hypothetical protein
MEDKFNQSNQEKKGYSPEFIKRVKAVFPDWTDLHQALDSGSEVVGRYLNDSQGTPMRNEELVKALEGGKQQEVLEKAKKLAAIDELYSEWMEAYRKTARLE